ncbi:Holliday junction resolvase RuvX [Hahella sp. HN01]|uniref:Holliday junction resolvase RuvX n=1 Tax=Hahella sp. HN01 TaxID=2847262 RepID=UPI001C1EA613|nr:Holliday junction resolvase RuvX [Hahella sp. HN01]MBU6954158.1 Holliday junction resolvase RuvX [Hahella sp. HN01]
MATVVGFDFGLKRFGAAVGQSVSMTASPLKEIPAQDGIPRWEAIEALLEEWKPALVIVGEPLNMDGSVSEMALRARKFARRLHGRYNLRVEMADERLTSSEAKSMVRERYGHRDFGRYAVDSIAAVFIVESWLETHADNLDAFLHPPRKQGKSDDIID